MTGRMASAPRVSGLRRRGRRAFLPAVLGASLSTLLLVLALAAPKLARAHEDSEEEGHASPNGTHGYHFEYYDRPPPPPPAQPTHYVGGVYDKNHSQTWHGEVEVVCTVVVKPGAYLAITPGATIKFRPNCTYEDAKLWGLTDPGGVGVSKPSIVVMRGAKLYAAGTAEKPIVFRPVDVDHSHHSDHSDHSDDHSDDHSHHSDHSEGGYVRGAWGGIVVMGTARVGWNAGAPTPDVETIVDRSGDAEFSAWYDEAPDAGHVASHVTHDAYAVARVPSGVFPSVPGLFGADGFLEYGGFRDNSSCGVVEHVVVLGGGGRNESNPAAGHGTDGYDMPALGFFGCGFATKVEHVEVAHSAGHGLYLGGGMVSPRRVAAWDNAGAGVKTTAGYRGVLDELFVHVPRDAEAANATGIRAEGFWAHGGGTADESVYRTHPMIFHATVVAEPNPPPPPMNESAASAACQRPSWVGSDGYGALDGTDRDEIYGTGSNTCQGEYFPLPSGCEIAQDSDETLEVIRNHPWGTHAMNTQTAVYSTTSYQESIWQRSPLVRVGAGGENEYKPCCCSFRILIICCPGPPPPPPPPPLPALVQIARGSGATVGNSIIAPSTEGGVAFSVDDCSPKLRVGHFRDVDPSAFASKSNDAVAVDDRVAVAGLGDDPPTKNSDYRDHDGSWSRRVVDSSPMPFNLGAGCEDAPLWRVNRNPPQFRSGSFTLDPRNATANRLDPRATAAMVAAAELDPVPPRIVDGVATRRDARTTWMLDSLFYRPNAVVNGSADGYESTNGSSAAQSTSTPAAQSTPAAHPGAFGPTHALPWFARVEADGDFDSRTRGAAIAPLTRSDPDPGYATMAAYADDACDGERLGEVAVRRGACYQVPDWIQAGDSPLSRLLPEEMHSTTSRGLHLIATSHTGDTKFSEAAVVNGKAVFTPFDVPAVYVVDLSTMETSIWDLPEPLGSSTWKFRGAAAAGGKVIFAPYKADDVGVFDPNDGSFEAISVSVEVINGATTRKFMGATRANNGHVIFAPSTAAGVGVFNPGAKTFELVAKDALANAFPDPAQLYKFSGAVTAANGKIVFVPDHANGVGVWNPDDKDGFLYVDISAPSSTVDLGGLSSFTNTNKFRGGASASNGKVVFAPYVANGVGVFDPNDNSFVLVDISAPSTTVNLGGLSGFTVAGKFGAAAAASNGNIIFAPYNADAVGVFDPIDSSFELDQGTHGSFEGTCCTPRFEGAAPLDNGQVLFVPWRLDYFGIYVPSFVPWRMDHFGIHTQKPPNCSTAPSNVDSSNPRYMRFDIDGTSVSVYEGSDAMARCRDSQAPSLTIALPIASAPAPSSPSQQYGNCTCLCEGTPVGNLNVTDDYGGMGIPASMCAGQGPEQCQQQQIGTCGVNYTTNWSYVPTYTGANFNDESSSSQNGVASDNQGPTGDSQTSSSTSPPPLATGTPSQESQSICGKIGNSYLAITDGDVAAGSIDSEDRVIMTEWQGASDCDDAGLPIWTFMDASRVTSDSEMFERDVLGMAPAAAPASTERCYGDGVGGHSYRLACTPTGALSVSTWFCSNCSAAVGPANETKEGEHPTVDKTADGWEICDADGTPRIVSSCGGLAVAQSFSGAVATASGPFGSFRRYRTPMEALREDHPLWVGSSLGKNATAATRDNDMLAGMGYETTSALPHLCVETLERESLGWTEHATANGGYLSIETDQPRSWCLGYDYVSLECPNSGGVRVWCVNAAQLEGAARLPAGHCRNELDGAKPNDSGCSGFASGNSHGYVWNGIDLGGAGRGSLYKQGYFAKLFPEPCDASIPIDNGNLGSCTASLAHGASCTPTCNTGYVLSGSRSCNSGQLTDNATCVELDHFCVDSTNRDTWGWVTHKPSTDNYGYISFDENPESWCADYDYVVLECPRLVDGGDLQAWCVNKTQMLAPPAANSDCNGGSLDQFCPGYGTDGVAVWNGIDLGGTYRGSAYKRDVFLTKLPGYVAPAPSPDPAPAPPPSSGPSPLGDCECRCDGSAWNPPVFPNQAGCFQDCGVSQEMCSTDGMNYCQSVRFSMMNSGAPDPCGTTISTVWTEYGTGR